MSNTEQSKTWRGEFGRRYTDRNPQDYEELDEVFVDYHGITRTELNREFLNNFDRDISILEVGTNVGAQLSCLDNMGFTNLFGVEIQEYAVTRAARLNPTASFVQADALNIPFEDDTFDLVFTSGVLIHIPPENIEHALREVARCATTYLWGYEYHADEYTEVQYRGNKDLLWKTDFGTLYEETIPGLTLVKERRLPYVDSDEVDSMYLLEFTE
jgi:pseudaminic acid biosynthesis-associated methylase